MTETDSAILDALSFIKANPNCGTEARELDGFLVKKLYGAGLIDGCDATTIHGGPPEFGLLNITIPGLEKLESLNSAAKTAVSSPPRWHSNPLISGAITLVVTLVAAFIVWRSGWLE